MSSWIDVTITSSVLTGGILLFCLALGWWGHNAIWQELIWRDCQSAIQEAIRLGFRMEKKGLAARWSMCQEIAGEQWYIRWHGGIWGAYSTVEHGSQKTTLPYLQVAEQVRRKIVPLVSGEDLH